MITPLGDPGQQKSEITDQAEANRGPEQFLTGSQLQLQQSLEKNQSRRRLILIAPIIVALALIAYTILYLVAGGFFGPVNIIFSLPYLAAIVLIGKTTVRWAGSKISGKAALKHLSALALVAVVLVLLPPLFFAYAKHGRQDRYNNYVRQLAKEVDYAVYLPGGNSSLNSFSFHLLKDEHLFGQTVRKFGGHYYVSGRKDYGVQFLANPRTAANLLDGNLGSIKILNKSYVPAVYKNCAPSLERDKIENLENYCVSHGATPKGREIFSFDDRASKKIVYYFDVGDSRVVLRTDYPQPLYNCDDNKRFIQEDGTAKTCREAGLYQKEAEKIFGFIDSFEYVDLKLMETDNEDSTGKIKFIE